MWYVLIWKVVNKVLENKKNIINKSFKDNIPLGNLLDEDPNLAGRFSCNISKFPEFTLRDKKSETPYPRILLRYLRNCISNKKPYSIDAITTIISK